MLFSGILKLISLQCFTPPVTYICNKSHLKCTFPTGLKFSALKTLYKKEKNGKGHLDRLCGKRRNIT